MQSAPALAVPAATAPMPAWAASFTAMRASGLTARSWPCATHRGAPGDQEEALPYEQHVEVEGRVDEVVRVQVARAERHRPVHDRDFVRVVDRREPVGQADRAQHQRDQEEPHCRDRDASFVQGLRNVSRLLR